MARKSLSCNRGRSGFRRRRPTDDSDVHCLRDGLQSVLQNRTQACSCTLDCASDRLPSTSYLFNLFFAFQWLADDGPEGRFWRSYAAAAMMSSLSDAMSHPPPLASANRDRTGAHSAREGFDPKLASRPYVAEGVRVVPRPYTYAASGGARGRLAPPFVLLSRLTGTA